MSAVSSQVSSPCVSQPASIVGQQPIVNYDGKFKEIEEKIEQKHNNLKHYVDMHVDEKLLEHQYDMKFKEIDAAIQRNADDLHDFVRKVVHENHVNMKQYVDQIIEEKSIQQYENIKSLHEDYGSVKKYVDEELTIFDTTLKVWCQDQMTKMQIDLKSGAYEPGTPLRRKLIKPTGTKTPVPFDIPRTPINKTKPKLEPTLDTDAVLKTLKQLSEEREERLSEVHSIVNTPINKNKTDLQSTTVNSEVTLEQKVEPPPAIIPEHKVEEQTNEIEQMRAKILAKKLSPPQQPVISIPSQQTITERKSASVETESIPVRQFNLSQGSASVSAGRDLTSMYDSFDVVNANINTDLPQERISQLEEYVDKQTNITQQTVFQPPPRKVDLFVDTSVTNERSPTPQIQCAVDQPPSIEEMKRQIEEGEQEAIRQLQAIEGDDLQDLLDSSADDIQQDYMSARIAKMTPVKANFDFCQSPDTGDLSRPIAPQVVNENAVRAISATHFMQSTPQWSPQIITKTLEAQPKTLDFDHIQPAMQAERSQPVVPQIPNFEKVVDRQDETLQADMQKEFVSPAPIMSQAMIQPQVVDVVRPPSSHTSPPPQRIFSQPLFGGVSQHLSPRPMMLNQQQVNVTRNVASASPNRMNQTLQRHQSLVQFSPVGNQIRPQRVSVPGQHGLSRIVSTPQLHAPMQFSNVNMMRPPQPNNNFQAGLPPQAPQQHAFSSGLPPQPPHRQSFNRPPLQQQFQPQHMQLPPNGRPPMQTSTPTSSNGARMRRTRFEEPPTIQQPSGESFPNPF